MIPLILATINLFRLLKLYSWSKISYGWLYCCFVYYSTQGVSWFQLHTSFNKLNKLICIFQQFQNQYPFCSDDTKCHISILHSWQLLFFTISSTLPSDNCSGRTEIGKSLDVSGSNHTQELQTVTFRIISECLTIWGN